MEHVSTVDDLFTRFTTAEITQFVDRTRDGIADKRRQLQELVGAGYRDLLGSADEAVAMHTSLQQLSGLLQELLQKSSAISSGPVPTPVAALLPPTELVVQHKAAQLVAWLRNARIQVLDCFGNGHVLHGVTIMLAAHLAFEAVQSWPELAEGRTALVQHFVPLQRLRARWHRAADRALQSQELGFLAGACAIAASCVPHGQDSSHPGLGVHEAIERVLTLRTLTIQQLLQHRPATSEAVVTQLLQVATSIRNTIWQVAFVLQVDELGNPWIHRLATSACHDAVAMATACVSTAPTAASSLPDVDIPPISLVLDPNAVGRSLEALRDWLSNVQAAVQQQVPALLQASASSGTMSASALKHVRSAIVSSLAPEDDPFSTWTTVDVSEVDYDFAALHKAQAAAIANRLNWDDAVSCLFTDTGVQPAQALWNHIFQGVVSSRAVELLQHTFRSSVQKVGSDLAALLAQIQANAVDTEDVTASLKAPTAPWVSHRAAWLHQHSAALAADVIAAVSAVAVDADSLLDGSLGPDSEHSRLQFECGQHFMHLLRECETTINATDAHNPTTGMRLSTLGHWLSYLAKGELQFLHTRSAPSVPSVIDTLCDQVATAWVDWCTTSVSTHFSAALSRQDWTVPDAQWQSIHAGWRKVILSDADDAATSADADSCMLPTCVSPALMQSLVLAPSHLLDHGLLSWVGPSVFRARVEARLPRAVLGCVSQCYLKTCTDVTPSDSAVLQILLDLRFCRIAFMHGSPTHGDAADLWQSAWSTNEDRIDAVDWAVYSQHIQRFADDQAASVKGLLTPLLPPASMTRLKKSFQRSMPGTNGTPAAAAPPSRLELLPISV